MSLWIVTRLRDDSTRVLPGDGVDQAGHQPGAEHHQHLGAADAAVAVGGARRLQHKCHGASHEACHRSRDKCHLQIVPDGGHNLQRDGQEGNVHEDVSGGDQGLADSV